MLKGMPPQRSQPSRPTLSRPELKRYSRQMLLPEFAQSQERFGAASLLLVGAGGLGCPIVSYLAGAGVGRLRISDSDTVDVSNLHRQTLYTSADVGRPKAQAAAARAQQINPFVQVQAVPALSAENAVELLSGIDLVIDASDNFSTRYLVEAECRRRGLPWVWGAASGLEGMVSVFDAQFGLSDLFSPEDSLAAPTADCATTGVWGPLLGVVGSVMASQALLRLSGESGLYLKLWTYDSLSAQARLITLKRPTEAQSRL